MPQTLVEKFVEVHGWTTARKTALLAGPLVVPGHAVGGTLSVLLLAPLPGVDVTGLIWMFVGFVTFCSACSLVCWWVGRSGAEGAWTFYLFAVPYSSLCVGMCFLYGVQSSPLLTWFAMQIIFTSIWYDARRAFLFFALGVGDYVALFVVSATDLLPYAPLLEDRSLDLQQEPRYVAAMMCTVLLYIVIGSLVAGFSAAARDLMQDRLDRAHRQLDEAAHLIARYVPAELAEDILSGESTGKDGYHRRKLTVFFSDLVGFSDVAEELEPEDLAVVLNEYFTEMTAIARRHGGTVDELQGDALLIFFGAPHQTTARDEACRAVAMAVEMQAAVPALNARWRESGITEELAVRMGINTGVVTVGHFGSADRMKYAALGKHVNIAARLQSLARPGTAVLSYATYLLVKDEVVCTPLGPQQLKGITRPVEAFEVVGTAPAPA